MLIVQVDFKIVIYFSNTKYHNIMLFNISQFNLFYIMNQHQKLK